MKAGQRGLCVLASIDVGAYAIDKRFEIVKRGLTRSKPVIKQLLTHGAFGPIQKREDVIHQKIAPGAIIEKYRILARPEEIRDSFHVSLTLSWTAPLRSDPLQQARSRPMGRPDAERDNRRH
jgi:hypothetical protein